MSSPSPLNEQEKADLVAYLDGELTGEAARAIEARLTLDPAVRAEAESLKRTWDLLDFLPRTEPSANFTEKTLSRLAPVRPEAATDPPRVPRTWRRLLLAGSWAAAVVVAVLAGYAGFHRLVPREAGEKELVRDLRLIENKRFYDVLDDFDFLRALDHPDLFGEETTTP